MTGLHPQIPHVQEIQLAPARLHAFALAEIAFVVSLTSADSGVSQLASKGLRILAETDRQPGAPLPSSGDQENRKNRNAVYEKLGDPNVMIVGMWHLVVRYSSSSRTVRTCWAPEAHKKTRTNDSTPNCDAYSYLGGVFLEVAVLVRNLD